MPGVAKTYENYYFEDASLLFVGALGESVRYGALVKMRERLESALDDAYKGTPARWRGLPIAPLTYHPSEPACLPRLTKRRRQALAEVLASTQGEMERIPEDLDIAAH